MKNVFTKKWLRCALVRAMKTVAQTAIATIGATAVADEVNWLSVVSASALAGLLSILTSVAGLPEAKNDGASETASHDDKEADNGKV